jgi:hypothetical protein
MVQELGSVVVGECAGGVGAVVGSDGVDPERHVGHLVLKTMELEDNQRSGIDV